MHLGTVIRLQIDDDIFLLIYPNQQSINEKEDVPSLAAGGRGIMLQVLRECSALSARDKTSQHSLENTSQPEVGK